MFKYLCLFFLIFAGSACAQNSSSRAETAIAKQTPLINAALDGKQTQLGQSVFIRIVKTVDGIMDDGYLELFLETPEGEFVIYKSWPICTYSGDLGPKLREGDGQSPEGFYFVKPNSCLQTYMHMGHDLRGMG